MFGTLMITSSLERFRYAFHKLEYIYIQANTARYKIRDCIELILQFSVFTRELGYLCPYLCLIWFLILLKKLIPWQLNLKSVD